MMGNLIHRALIRANPQVAVPPLKRKRSELEEKIGNSNLHEEIDAANSPLKKKIATSKQYIYQTLFVEGKGSDVTIDMLGVKWHLHKLYLQQSEYFNAMFSAKWNENSAMTKVKILIIDDNINVEALRVVLGSMYDAEVSVPPSLAINVLAAASFLQLHDLASAATSVMIETIDANTVLKYYDTASKYCLPDLKQVCYTWLLVHMTSSLTSEAQIKSISVELLLELVQDASLFVINTEVTLYYYIKSWFFLRNSGPSDQDDVNSFILAKKGSALKEASEDVKKIFSTLHLPHLLLNSADIDMVTNDRIFSERQLLDASQTLLKNILRIDQNLNVNVDMVSVELFNKNCLRFGRRIDAQLTSWHWVGFKFGMDLIFVFDGHSLFVTWNAVGDKLLDNRRYRRILFRMYLVSSLIQYMKHPITPMILSPDEQILIAYTEETVTYPLMLSFHVLLFPPLPDAP